MTEYQVFHYLDTEDAWRGVGRGLARSAKAAIQTHLDSTPAADGTYAAVPARSWKPVTVKVETKTALRFS